MTPVGLGGRARRIRGAIGGALWPLPSTAIVLAIALGLGLPVLDRQLQAGSDPLGLLFSGGPSAARTMLSAIASSLISVTTLLFSLTIVTLQLASSQYTPRLLQTFVRDRVVQGCLGVLLGTFVFALTVLRSVRSADESDSGAFVPRLAVTVAFVLTLASVAALVIFLSHQTRQLRVETMLRDVHVEASSALRRTARQLDGRPDGDLPDPPAGAFPVLARRSGFHVHVDDEALVAGLSRAGAVLRLVPRPGDAVIAGTPLGWAWPRGSDDDPAAGDLARLVEEHMTVGYEREDVDDPSYGLRKLVDIAVRALSPGINDPTTAVHALSHVSDLLGLAAARDAWHREVSDGAGTPRLLVTSWDFAELLDLAVTQPRYYGRDDGTLVERLFALLTEVAWRTRTERQRAAVASSRDQLREQCLAAPPPGRSVGDVHRWAAAVDAGLEGARRPQALGPPAT